MPNGQFKRDSKKNFGQLIFFLVSFFYLFSASIITIRLFLLLIFHLGSFFLYINEFLIILKRGNLLLRVKRDLSNKIEKWAFFSKAAVSLFFYLFGMPSKEFFL